MVSNFDLHLKEFNFTGGLIALAAIRSGLKVALEVNQPISAKFEPELSCFYPASVSHSKRAFSDFQFLLKCSSLFPQLYFPKRMLFLQQKGKFNSGFSSAFDQLLGRDRESASLPIRTARFKDYQSISKFFERGLLVYEYQFDRNWAIVEILKICLNEGAFLVQSNGSISAQLTLNCLPFQSELCSFKLHSYYPFPNPIRVRTQNIELVLNAVFSETILQIRVRQPFEVEDLLIKEVITALQQLQIDFPIEITDWLKRLRLNSLIHESYIEKEIQDATLTEQRQNVNQLKRRLENSLGKRISLKKAFSSYSEKAITSENFRFIQNECDEKFDLAKQTGIGYSLFSYLFYRYRNSIDQLIEAAYAKMNEERDPNLIWQQVENDFIKHELKIAEHIQNFQ